MCFEATTAESLPVSGKLVGLTVVVSGVFENYDRNYLKEMLVSHGAKISSAISGKTDLLIAGEKMGPSKRVKAEKLGVKIISEIELERLFQKVNRCLNSHLNFSCILQYSLLRIF